MGGLTGHTESTSDLTGLDRFDPLEEVDDLTFPIYHQLIVTSILNNRKHGRQKRKMPALLSYQQPDRLDPVSCMPSYHSATMRYVVPLWKP